MSWPAAHRSGSAKYQSGPKAGSFQSPPRPANDNIRVPAPANDNAPRFPGRPTPPKQFGRRLPPAAKAIARRSFAAARLFRVVPWLAWGLTAYDLYQYLRPRVANNQPMFDYTRYNLVSTCKAGGVPQARTWFNCNAVQGSYQPVTTPRPSIIRTWWLYPEIPYSPTPGWFRQEPGQRWDLKPGSSADRSVWPAQSVAPRPNPSHWPAVDPFIYPPMAPQPEPIALPRNAVTKHKPDPYRGDWSESGPSSVRRTRAGVSHRIKPPGPRVKEKKSKLRAGFGLALKGAYFATEVVDFIEALYDGVQVPGYHFPPALPKEFLTRGLSPQQKAQALYEHWDAINVQQALLNLAANQLIDLAVGTSIGNANKFATDLGITNHQGLLSGGVKVVG